MVGTATCSTDEMEAPADGGDDPEEAGDGPEAYEPVLTDEERLELRRAWLAMICPLVEGEQETRHAP